MELITQWFKRQLANPQVVILAILLLTGFALVLGTGKILAPVFAALIIAYLLEALVAQLENLRVPRILGVLLVFTGFMTLFLLLIFGLIPLLARQVTELVQQFPSFISAGQTYLLRLPEQYPDIFSEEQIRALLAGVGDEIATLGQTLVAKSLTTVGNLMVLMIYLVLIPILVFFFLKDKERIIGWFSAYLPQDHGLARSIWRNVDGQIGNYIRGKTVEIFMVGAVSFITFRLMGLDYSFLLATLVGVSVLIPFIGAALVTIPVALVGLFQFGANSEFAYLMVGYLIIQALDGNVLVPLLFSEVVNLHPVAIILAVLIFGGLWGVWGVFFAIPLATLVQAILEAWPTRSERQVEAK